MVASKRGFTLMELIMVVGILSVLFAIGPRLLLQANREFIMIRAKMDLQREARAAMYTITRALRQAHASTIVVSNVANQPYYSKIYFVKEQEPGSLVTSTMTFQQEGTQLVQLMAGSASNRRVLTKNLNYLAFTFPRTDDMGIISVSLTLQKNIYEGRTKALHMASEKVRVMND